MAPPEGGSRDGYKANSRSPVVPQWKSEMAIVACGRRFNIRPPERRAISRGMPTKESRRPSVIAEKAQHMLYEEWVRGFQRRLYRSAKADAERSFGILYDKVCSWSVLVTAWRRVAANAGASGVDRQSIESIKQEYGVGRFLMELQAELRGERYVPLPVLRRYIPKGDGRQRPLGIPAVRDRVVQMAVKLVIEPLFEADFCPCSYGFRPQRSNQQAANEVHRLVNRKKWVVDVDLKSYFDTIPHDGLMALVRRRVRDPKVLHLIRGWLKAGILDGRELQYGTAGTPQGGVLSPLLSNIYLHELDRTWNPRNGDLIRFADDFVILCGTRKAAETALALVRARVADLGLTVNEEKTCIGHVRDGFDFLGFTYREAWSARQGRPVRIKYPRAKALKKARALIKERVSRVPTGAPLEEVITRLNRSLRGWAQYFRIGNSYAAAAALNRYACAQLRLWLRRKKNCKRIAGTRRWPNGFFHQRGLFYLPELLHA